MLKLFTGTRSSQAVTVTHTHTCLKVLDMHSDRDSTLDGLGRVGAETDLRMDIKVWTDGGGEGAPSNCSEREWELRSFLCDAKWRGWWARHADPWHPAVQCKGRGTAVLEATQRSQSASIAGQPRNLSTPPCHPVCGVVCVYVPSLPPRDHASPPLPRRLSPSVFLAPSLSLYRAAVTGQSQHEQVPCPACLAQLSHVSS